MEDSPLALSEVILPVPGKTILQDTVSQGVSLASELLYQAALQEYPDKPLKVLELGSGCGIISIMCALHRPSWQITGIEIQSPLVELAIANAKRCEVPVSFVQGDLRTSQGKYDLILSNPPWMKARQGLLSPHQSRNLSKFEQSCTMADVLETLSRCLKPQGEALLLYPESRLADLYKAIIKTFLDINIVHSHYGKKAFFVSKLRLQEQ